jgi:hypothetical protein
MRNFNVMLMGANELAWWGRRCNRRGSGMVDMMLSITTLSQETTLPPPKLEVAMDLGAPTTPPYVTTVA